jgi:class I fructose-bisphosphate aldolase
MPDTANPRPRLADLSVDLGRRTRLHRILYEHGPGNGTLLILPIDQGLEHGPVDFFPNPASADPEYQFRLALEGNYSAIALHYGLAQRYMEKYAGAVPLVLKINGKTNIPSDAGAFSPLTAQVEDAVRLGADAIGYTLYVGSPNQAQDINQFMEVRRACDKYGMPIIMWAYPRGEAIGKKGGKDSIYAIDYAARVACELGADIVKLNLPNVPRDGNPGEYLDLNEDLQARTNRLVRSAGRSMVLFSGGSKVSDDDLMNQVEVSLNAGATGIIFGRNMWQRPFDEALAISQRVHETFGRYGDKA